MVPDKKKGFTMLYSDAGKEREEGGREGGREKTLLSLESPLYLPHNQIISLMSFKTIMKENFLQRLSRDLLTPSSN